MKNLFFLLGLAILLAGLPLTSHAQSSPTPTLDHKGGDFRIAFGGGYAYRLGKAESSGSSSLDNLTKEMRSGYSLNMDMQYYPGRVAGIGLNLNYVQSQGKAYGMTDRQSVIYVGPALALRADGRTAIGTFEVGCGGLFLTDKVSGSYGGKISGSAFGIHLGMGVDFKVTSGMALGAKISSDIGNVKKIKSSGSSTTLDKGWSASSLMLTGFISFRTWK